MTDVYEFIDAEYATRKNAPAVTQMCAWLDVSKSGFYDWRSRPESATAKRQKKLRLLIRKIFDDSDGTYGYRRIAGQLARQGIAAGAELVRKLMRQLGLVACQPRPWRPTATKQGQAGPIPDLVNRDFSAGVPGAKMVGDKGYIGNDMITPFKKPEGGELLDWQKEFNTQVDKIRWVIEQVIANFKTWRIMHTDYRRPLATFPETISAVVALHFYATV